jgi:adenylylsulfate reductase subunit B
MAPVIDKKLCIQCGTCYDMCPQDCFTWRKGESPIVAYPRECWYCGACVIDCSEDAIHLELPLHMHIVPSPALYGPPGPEEAENLRKAAEFSRSVVRGG